MLSTASYSTPVIIYKASDQWLIKSDTCHPHVFFEVCLRQCFSTIRFQNASNKQCSMCGPAVETHTVHRPVGHCLISLVQQVLFSSKTCLNPDEVFLSSHVISFPRVYLLYHTWGQVFYGGIAGSTIGIVWFFITQEVLTPIFPKIAAW